MDKLTQITKDTSVSGLHIVCLFDCQKHAWCYLSEYIQALENVKTTPVKEDSCCLTSAIITGLL